MKMRKSYSSYDRLARKVVNDFGGRIRRDSLFSSNGELNEYAFYLVDKIISSASNAGLNPESYITLASRVLSRSRFLNPRAIVSKSVQNKVKGWVERQKELKKGSIGKINGEDHAGISFFREMRDRVGVDDAVILSINRLSDEAVADLIVRQEIPNGKVDDALRLTSTERRRAILDMVREKSRRLRL